MYKNGVPTHHDYCVSKHPYFLHTIDNDPFQDHDVYQWVQQIFQLLVFYWQPVEIMSVYDTSALVGFIGTFLLFLRHKRGIGPSLLTRVSLKFSIEISCLFGWLADSTSTTLTALLYFWRACSFSIIRIEGVCALHVADAGLLRFTYSIFLLLSLNQDAVSRFLRGFFLQDPVGHYTKTK